MLINSLNNNFVFKGHEAKKLNAIVVQSTKDESNELYRELDAIANSHKVPIIRAKNRHTWMQDDFVVTHKGRYFGCASKTMKEVIEKYGLNELELSNANNRICVEPAGGNMIFVTNKKGETILLTARNLPFDMFLGSEEEFEVDKIIELPHGDYHIDLFVTAIGDNKILVADDELMLDNMQKMIKKIDDYLSLDTDDVVSFCMAKIKEPHAAISRNGKNWYIRVDGIVITVNAYSYTIITAHKEKRVCYE